MADGEVDKQDELKQTIGDVVNSVKSEGLFDQFRKECLEQFESMVIIIRIVECLRNQFYSALQYFLPKQKKTKKRQYRHVGSRHVSGQ